MKMFRFCLSWTKLNGEPGATAKWKRRQLCTSDDSEAAAAADTKNIKLHDICSISIFNLLNVLYYEWWQYHFAGSLSCCAKRGTCNLLLQLIVVESEAVGNGRRGNWNSSFSYSRLGLIFMGSPLCYFAEAVNENRFTSSPSHPFANDRSTTSRALMMGID